jgi:hypothetical protein
MRLEASCWWRHVCCCFSSYADGPRSPWPASDVTVVGTRSQRWLLKQGFHPGSHQPPEQEPVRAEWC